MLNKLYSGYQNSKLFYKFIYLTLMVANWRHIISIYWDRDIELDKDIYSLAIVIWFFAKFLLWIQNHFAVKTKFLHAILCSISCTLILHSTNSRYWGIISRICHLITGKLFNMPSLTDMCRHIVLPTSAFIHKTFYIVKI